MALKELTVPQRIILLEALKRWLKPGHDKQQDIEKDLAKRYAGYWGEISLSNHVKNLPYEKYLILHDLQLEYNGFRFQIDTLIITQNYILIIEAKNIIGTLIFDNVYDQLIRQCDDGREEVFENPHVQANRLRSLLSGVLANYGFSKLPIDYLIFFKSATKTILKNGPGEHPEAKKVCKGRDVLNKIEGLEKKHSGVKVDKAAVEKLGKLLVSLHKPEQLNILEEYKLTVDDLRLGMKCLNPQCGHTPINYSRGNWICPSCHTTSKEAHIQALTDYFLLIKPSITNSEFCRFIGLPTNDTAQKILLSLKLPSTGKTKGTVYLPWPEKVRPCVS